MCPADGELAPGDLPASQREILARCRHPSGVWAPFDALSAEISVPARFRAVAARHPERVAVLEPAGALTYAQLVAGARRVAAGILDDELVPGGGAVAILSSLDSSAVLAVLGALEAGRIFVVPDRSLSLAAKRRVLDDANVDLILADAGHLDTARDLAGGRRRVLPLEDLRRSRRAEADGPDIAPDMPATIIYTSGTTGPPRGVVHTHRTLLAEAALAANPFGLSDADRVACPTSLAWLASLFTLLAPLVVGSCACPFDVAAHGIEPFAAWACAARLTHVGMRVVVRQLLQRPARTVFPDARVVILGGDTIYRQDIEAIRDAFPNAIVGTGLASSEAGRVSYLLIDRATPLPAVVPLGYAVPGKRVRILGQDGQDAEPSDAGQIAVQSRHLAVGYWRQPDLTAARLAIVGPGGERLCLTGDLGRRLDDGCLVHLGRADLQVKTRGGYHVPLNAVEAALLELDGVREAAVVTHESDPGQRRLVGYVAPAAVRPEDLRRALSAALPAHMVPQVFVCLDALPRTGSGKVDRGALPPPGRARPAVATPFAAPRDEVERLLAVAWAIALDLEEVGVDDPFLELGGDSLAAMRIGALVAQVTRAAVPLSELLNAATIAEMANVVREHVASGQSAAPGTS